MGAAINIEGKRVLVVGSGLSGAAATELLKKKGAFPVLFDGNRELDTGALRRKSPVFADVEIITGEWRDEELAGVVLAILSPGVPADGPVVRRLGEQGIPVWGEIELAYRFAHGRLAAITGTNGKTTTTALTGAILAEYFADVKVVGNIGIPYTSVAADTTEDTVTVAEISSFQLETVCTFHPQISAILNITPDHLDRHHTMECYTATKERIVENQKAGELCVLNYEDDVLRAFGEQMKTNVLFFSGERRLERGLYLEEDSIWYADADPLKSAEAMDSVEKAPSMRAESAVKVISVSELNLLGRHNYENVMAAVGIAIGFGVPIPVIAQVLRKFRAVEHRIEYVTEKRGVRFYNDSKGTNPDAAIKGIQAMNRPTFLIGGGYDKHSEYDEWIESFGGKVKKLVLIGQTKEKIAECARKHGFTDVVMCGTLEEAVDVCFREAVFGDAVLLSPACASWGMFANYEERGRIFREYVHSLQ